VSHQDDLDLVRSCVDPVGAGCQYPRYLWPGVPEEYGIYTSECLNHLPQYKEKARPLLEALRACYDLGRQHGKV
jgi:hypothetical protein